MISSSSGPAHCKRRRKLTKYYKSLFLGLIDLAIVSAFIYHKETANVAGTTPMKRAVWHSVLQN